jgi:hypothetical protein
MHAVRADGLRAVLAAECAGDRVRRRGADSGTGEGQQPPRPREDRSAGRAAAGTELSSGRSDGCARTGRRARAGDSGTGCGSLCFGKGGEHRRMTRRSKRRRGQSGSWIGGDSHRAQAIATRRRGSEGGAGRGRRTARRFERPLSAIEALDKAGSGRRAVEVRQVRQVRQALPSTDAVSPFFRTICDPLDRRREGIPPSLAAATGAGGAALRAQPSVSRATLDSAAAGSYCSGAPPGSTLRTEAT